MSEIIQHNLIYIWFSEPITWGLFLLGLILGSFYNVCIWRMPEENFWKSARSRCRGCEALIPWYHNIPLFSWLYLKGRAKCCGSRISVQYPLVELATGILLVFIYIKFPFVGVWNGDVQIDPADLIRFFHAFIFVSVLLIASVIDLRHMIIPDELSLGLVVTTPLVVWLMPGYQWQDALIGVLVGGGCLYLIAWIYWVLRKTAGMGMGDVKLLAGIGGWLGWQSIFPVVLYSSVLGSIVGVLLMLIKGKKDMRFEIPFGPFLAVGAIIQMYFGGRVIEIFLDFLNA